MTLLFQCVVMIVLARLLWKPMAYIGQPKVIGEMTAGFILGPTVLGALLPTFSNLIFPADSLPMINTVGGIVVAVYIFVVGLEFDQEHIHGKIKPILGTAAGSILIPAVGGFCVAGLLYDVLRPSAPEFAFKLFFATCFSVTAFPVLLRTLEDRNMEKSATGVYAMAIAAVIELVAWGSLPIVLSIAKGGDGAYKTAALAITYLAIWVTLVKKIADLYWQKVRIDGLASWIGFLAVGIGSAYIAEIIGIHKIIGAFVGGFILPRQTARFFIEKIKVPATFLLPIFFAAAGLKCKLGLENGSDDLILTLGLVIFAYSIKVVGSAIPAKIFRGVPNWNSALAVGHLMGSKGAMELAIIGIGLSSGLLDQRTFSMLAIVTIANTAMTPWGITTTEVIATRKAEEVTDAAAA